MNMTEILDGEILTAHGIINVNELESELKQCDSEPQRLAVIAGYLLCSEETIDMVRVVILSLYN